MKKSKIETLKNEENNITSKPFLPILKDAVLFSKHASTTHDKQFSKMLTRASIIHCSFTVEALANNMIQFINLGGRFSESIDKLDIVAKFELFTLLTSKKKIDRGTYCIQVFQDLIEIRNKYVHPKIQKNELSNEGGKLITKCKKSYSQLNIRTFRDTWEIQDSQICVSALLKSLDQFLLEVVGLEMKSMSCMFMDFLSVNGLYGPIVPSDTEWAEWAENELKYRPKFYCDHILMRYK